MDRAPRFGRGCCGFDSCQARKKMNWFVYILECSDKSLYTGITTDIPRRIIQHNSKLGAKSLFGKLPVKLVYNEALKDRSKASIREAEIKKLDRIQKLKLITGR